MGTKKGIVRKKVVNTERFVLAARRRTPEWQQTLLRLQHEGRKKMAPEIRSELARHAAIARWAQWRTTKAGTNQNVVS